LFSGPKAHAFIILRVFVLVFGAAPTGEYSIRALEHPFANETKSGANLEGLCAPLVLMLTSGRPEIASFGPVRRSRSFEILDFAGDALPCSDSYTVGFKFAAALARTNIHDFWMDTN
jgi:hypothetical protein